MAEKTATFHVREMGRSVTVRGLEPLHVDQVLDVDPSWRHPHMLELLCAALVRPAMSPQMLAGLSDQALDRICMGAMRVSEPRIRVAIHSRAGATA